ncbi:hypothetical protein SH580_05305 [Coraliomargarita algicola]|uniref:Uncharacterized protein n=1 Tax=Coraliomargarita algicola TaxID=3092156 RepID=A0ABZ0RPQ1_9BACT|nr:hypothetical protein [Coraliomargarita sp. J2-16]WPJ97123.1 hypothetical protein SH580_05305 [Coraliomargarita sp. J2-16]
MKKLFISTLIASTCASAFAAVVTVDAPQANSLILENFSAPSDPSSEQRNGVRFVSAQDGVAKYSITDRADPQLFFDGYVGGIDFSNYPHVRIRHSFSEPNKGGSVYPMPVREGKMGKVSINNTLAGRQVMLEEYPQLGQGLRLDPVDGEHVPGEYCIDYIIVDRGRTLGFEFDQTGSTRGGLNNFFIGNNLGGENGKEIVSGIDRGVFNGKPVSSDSMMILQLTPATGLTAINSKIYKFIEIRMRVLEPQQGVGTVFFRSETANSGSSKIEFDLVDDEYFHTYLIDLREDASWNSGMINSFRFDPTNRKQAFEIDHIRFYETVKFK